MKKAIAGVLVVLGMFLTPGATRYAPVVVLLPLLSLLSPVCTNLLGLGAFLCGLPGCSLMLAV